MKRIVAVSARSWPAASWRRRPPERSSSSTAASPEPASAKRRSVKTALRQPNRVRNGNNEFGPFSVCIYRGGIR